MHKHTIIDNNIIGVPVYEYNVTRYDIVVDRVDLKKELSKCTFNHFRFRFIQREHRGGFCDCWAVANLKATLTNREERNLRLNQLFQAS